MKIRFVLYVAIAAVLVTAAGAFADARRDHLAKLKAAEEAVKVHPETLL